jgi:hypothetical protein
MKSEVMLDFCFIRESVGQFKQEIENVLHTLFKTHRLHWYMDEKEFDNVEMVVAEVRGIGNFGSEEAVHAHIEMNAESDFWEWLQGYRFQVYPVNKGCACHGNR